MDLSESHGAAKAGSGLPITQVGWSMGKARIAGPFAPIQDLEDFPGCRKKHLDELCCWRQGPRP